MNRRQLLTWLPFASLFGFTVEAKTTETKVNPRNLPVVQFTFEPEANYGIINNASEILKSIPFQMGNYIAKRKVEVWVNSNDYVFLDKEYLFGEMYLTQRIALACLGNWWSINDATTTYLEKHPHSQNHKMLPNLSVCKVPVHPTDIPAEVQKIYEERKEDSLPIIQFKNGKPTNLQQVMNDVPWSFCRTMPLYEGWEEYTSGCKMIKKLLTNKNFCLY